MLWSIGIAIRISIKNGTTSTSRIADQEKNLCMGSDINLFYTLSL